MTLPFGEGDNKEIFKYSLFLVSCNRLVAATIAFSTLMVRTGWSILQCLWCWQLQAFMDTGQLVTVRKVQLFLGNVSGPLLMPWE